MKNQDFGIIYLGFGEPYLVMAINSYISLKKSNPDIPACIITNVAESPPPLKEWSSQDCWIYLNQTAEENRLIKTNIIDFSPFEKTLYLDGDTMVLKDISMMSFFLDHFDITLRPGHENIPERDGYKKLFEGRYAFSDLPHWNGGVFGFRKSEGARAFFKEWNKRYKEHGFKRDQPSLIEALFFTNCSMLSINRIWNSGDRVFEPNKKRKNIKIWHYKLDLDLPLYNDLAKINRLLAGHSPEYNGKKFENYVLKNSLPRTYQAPRNAIKNLVRKIKGRLPELIQ